MPAAPTRPLFAPGQTLVLEGDSCTARRVPPAQRGRHARLQLLACRRRQALKLAAHGGQARGGARHAQHLRRRAEPHRQQLGEEGGGGAAASGAGLGEALGRRVDARARAGFAADVSLPVMVGSPTPRMGDLRVSETASMT